MRFAALRALENAMRGRFSDDMSTAKFGGLNTTAQELRQIDRILLCACGTAWHACLVGEYLIERFARIPVEVEYASQFRYRNAPLDKNTLVLFISQSGETIDTLIALRESKRKGYKTPRHQQHCGLYHRPRIRWRNLSTRLSRNRGGLH